jgi:hypothetical protein
MRIKFLRETDAELATIPESAWGALLVTAKQIEAPAVVDGQFAIPTHAPVSHCFPAGVAVELPEDLAAGYVASGAAELAPLEGGPAIWGSRPEVQS